MFDPKPVTDFLTRQSSKVRIAAETRRRERKPRTGGDYAGLDHTAIDQLSQARLNKNAMLGPRLARI